MQRTILILLTFLTANTFLISLQTFAEGSKIDSLLHELKSAPDQEIPGIYNSLAKQYTEKLSLDTALLYAAKALKTAKKENNPEEQANALYNIGHIYYYKNDPEKTLSYLEKSLKINKQINNKENISVCLNDIGFIYYFWGKYDKALKYFQQALKIDEKLGREAQIARDLNNIGYVYYSWGKYDKALKYFQQALKIDEKFGQEDQIAICLNNIGMVYDSWGKYDKAIEYYQQALKIDEKFGQEDKIAILLNNIGAVYYSWGKYQKAIEYFQQALKIAEKLGQEDKIAILLNNIGNVYNSWGKSASDPKATADMYDKAIEYYQKALKIAEKLGQEDKIASYLNNIGIVYDYWGKYHKAIEYFQKSLKIAEKLEQEDKIAIYLNNIGGIYDFWGKYDKALEYYQQALDINEKLNAKPRMMENYKSFYKTYKTIKNYKKALEYYKLYSEVKDSLFNEESHKQITEMMTKYETEKKEKELIKKDAELTQQKAAAKRQKIVSWSVGSGLFLVLIFSVLLYNRFRVTRRQKKVIEGQNKDITDSIHYAEQIQRASLPKDEEVERLLPENFVLFKPKDIVSGDFYWLGEEAGKVFFAACDCTGHGVPGAFMSMMINALLSEAVNEKGITKPSLIFYEVRNGIIKSLKQTGAEGEQKDGMDAVLCMWDKANNKLEFAAAYNSLYLIRKDELLETKGDKQPIGFYLGEQMPFTNHEIKLQKEDIIYIFSDGYADQFGGPGGKKFKSKPFRQLLVDVHKKDMAEQKAILEKTFEDWKGNLEQVDDVLVMGIRI